MPKFLCDCGNVIRITLEGESDQERILVIESNLSKVYDMLHNGNCDTECIMDVFYSDAKRVLLCEKCGKIHIDELRTLGVYETYIKKQ